MAYTIEGNLNLLDTLVLNKNTSSLKINVRNNESIKFDLSAFKDEYIKIVLNFGDETEEEYILKPLYSSTGAISIDAINWATTEHYFAFKSEDDFIENKEMQINIYSIDEKKYKNIKIQYTVTKNALSGISRSLTLLNANIRNDGKIAYTIQNDADRQIIFFNSVDTVV